MKNNDDSNSINDILTFNITNKNFQEKPQNTNNEKLIFFWNKNKKKLLLDLHQL